MLFVVHFCFGLHSTLTIPSYSFGNNDILLERIKGWMAFLPSPFPFLGFKPKICLYFNQGWLYSSTYILVPWELYYIIVVILLNIVQDVLKCGLKDFEIWTALSTDRTLWRNKLYASHQLRWCLQTQWDSEIHSFSQYYEWLPVTISALIPTWWIAWETIARRMQGCSWDFI